MRPAQYRVFPFGARDSAFEDAPRLPRQQDGTRALVPGAFPFGETVLLVGVALARWFRNRA